MLNYIDKLQRTNADDLAFYPLATLEKALESGHILTATENGDPCGYLWFGAVRPAYPVVVYQACIDYDVRRRQHGWAMVGELFDIARAAGAASVRLKCASSALSNEFWQAIGFVCTNVTPGGIKRARDINHWYAPIQPELLTIAGLQPSTRKIDLTEYNRMKREGRLMPSRFSRTHYGTAPPLMAALESRSST